MMKVLIDTHIALWALMDDPKMPKEAEKILMDENNEIYLVRHLFGKLQ
ncbi:MAG: type II toxin-antitoxin system VapC family toxin [Lachnospiraceae bacterium]|nr:type II toxin-antitoxin system VapC family toxin [Lachnospiraceae bacterium]